MNNLSTWEPASPTRDGRDEVCLNECGFSWFSQEKKTLWGPIMTAKHNLRNLRIYEGEQYKPRSAVCTHDNPFTLMSQSQQYFDSPALPPRPLSLILSSPFPVPCELEVAALRWCVTGGRRILSFFFSNPLCFLFCCSSSHSKRQKMGQECSLYHLFEDGQLNFRVQVEGRWLGGEKTGP